MDGSKSMNRLDKCLKIASRYRVTSLLDIGGGDGEFAQKLMWVTKAREGIVLDKTKNFFIKDTPLPYQNHSFDFIFAGNMVDIVPDPDFLLKEIKRLLKGGGVCLLTTPSLGWWMNKMAVLFGFQPYGDRPSTEYNVGKMFIKPHKFSEKNAGYFHHFTRRGLKQLVEIYGFRVKFHTLPLQRFIIAELR